VRGARRGRAFVHRTEVHLLPVAVLAVALLSGSASPTAAALAPRTAHAARAASRFQPLAITFASGQVGWAAGTVSCGHGRRCLALRETTDAGRSWTDRAIPAALSAAVSNGGGEVQGVFTDTPLSLNFSGPRNGWLSGSIGLWSTRDGGRSWRRGTPPDFSAPREASVLGVASTAGLVYVLGWSRARGVKLEVSRIGAGRWRSVWTPAHSGLPAGGGPLEGAIVLQGDSGWVVEGNDRGMTASARLEKGGRWIRWMHPCGAVGDSYVVPVPVGPRGLDVTCVMGGFAYPLSSKAPPGATIDSSWLYSSHDGGTTFSPVSEISRGGPLGELFAPAPGVLLLAQYGGGLMENIDGGPEWPVIYPSYVRTLAFATPERWLGITEAPGRGTSAISTEDGGHEWTSVNF
jgi:photosystem II stability/assembly factor-like uncharacterized protein